MVKKTGAKCAGVHDSDVDWIIAFDNKWRYISGDNLLVLFAWYFDAKRVVTTNDASMTIEESAYVRCIPVDNTYVSEVS